MVILYVKVMMRDPMIIGLFIKDYRHVLYIHGTVILVLKFHALCKRFSCDQYAIDVK